MPIWLMQSAFAAVLLTPAWLAVPFFKKNFNVHPATFCAWYFLGTGLAIATFGIPKVSSLVPSLNLVLLILLFGAVLGGLSNLALFSATAAAPNPGLPVAIGNTTAVMTFVFAWYLARKLPAHFDPVLFDWRTLSGITLVIAGVSLIAIR